MPKTRLRTLLFGSVLLPTLALSGVHIAHAATGVFQNPTAAQNHDAAVQFVAVIGARAALLGVKENAVEQGKLAMRQNYPKYDPQFIEEWGKRSLARYNVDDYLKVIVGVYEKYFTTEELNELSAASKAPGGIAGAKLAQPLRDKLAANTTSIQSEIIGGCTQVGAKLGGEIGIEIGKEHPEWIKPN
ncbi:hypothetical protein Terro_2772 [Terriglobus roseus DSM 18391]|uniref:DUF2059 domain-containing protein n=1 Tax=Terriglobus roseus (strain DSM 18391 / NRRL B-41598 / KBS 63) TaxID=926566 RepID=I3ZIE0_TERRK|nr:hypothetical protein [Terriglobus roseus]AFL89008.1 hypothetical protein Terro_2772 [Terriglobus roseus DSM 18391]